MPVLRTHRRHERPTAVAPSERPETFEAGRICRGCRARLSIYNDRDKCWACEPRGRTITFNGAMDNRPDVISFQQLLEEPPNP
jgi:hypothetical protein